MFHGSSIKTTIWNRYLLILIFFLLILHPACTKSDNVWKIHQLTFRAGINHDLDNNLNFSPDNQWLCYDTRPESGIANSLTIERVHILTGEIDTIYQAPNAIEDLGPGVAAVSYFPTDDRVIFIHGLDTKKGLAYSKTRRVGAMVEPAIPTKVMWADARDVTFPYIPGALRGGTHRHEPGGNDGKWVGFTYDDMIMANLGTDLRTIGVTRLDMPVKVDQNPTGENNDGEGFSVLVVRVTAQPDPDTNQICRAFGDSWVGRSGYLKADGTRQLARGFIAELANGHHEVFIVDVPQDITQPGPQGPLQGTKNTFPMPPAGTRQQRLTFTKSGCLGNVRSDPDGKWLTFRTTDSESHMQIFMISPHGGKPIQLTFLPHGVESEARWHFSGEYIVYAADHRIYITKIVQSHADFAASIAVTNTFPSSPKNIIWSPNGKYIAFNRELEGSLQIFIIETEKRFWQQ